MTTRGKLAIAVVLLAVTSMGILAQRLYWDARERESHAVGAYATVYVDPSVDVDTVGAALRSACEAHAVEWKKQLDESAPQSFKTEHHVTATPLPDSVACEARGPFRETHSPDMWQWQINAPADYLAGNGVAGGNFRQVYVTLHLLPRRPVLYVSDFGYDPSRPRLDPIRPEDRPLADSLIASLRSQGVCSMPINDTRATP